MKKFILAAALFALPALSFALDCSKETSAEEVLEQKDITTDIPNHLKGAKIIVRLADGSESEVPAEKFKVVPRKQQYLVTKTQIKETNTCVAVSAEKHKNRLSALGGYGVKGGLKSSSNGSVAEVESDVGAVLGLQYQRNLTERFSLGVQGQNNSTGSIVLGVDF